MKSYTEPKLMKLCQRKSDESYEQWLRNLEIVTSHTSLDWSYLAYVTHVCTLYDLFQMGVTEAKVACWLIATMDPIVENPALALPVAAS